MKAINTIPHGMYFNSPLPLSVAWGKTGQQTKRVRRTSPEFTLNTDELASASRQEVVCAVLLALCLLYTIVAAVGQLAV